jgi:RHS repeat-associated protein
VTNGKLTIQPAWLAGALLPRINFIEIGKVGSTLDAATIARAQAAALKATQDTGKPKPKTPPVVKRNIWGTYVDELVSYTVKKPRKSPVRYYAHANSVAATTNISGSIVERYSYNAYGVRTVKNSVGATLAKSAVYQERGFTGYKLDSETVLYFCRTRYLNSVSGRFLNRMPWALISGTVVSNYEMLSMPSWWMHNFDSMLLEGHSSYCKGRFNLYDFSNNSPSNYVEPFSNPAAGYIAGNAAGYVVGAGLAAIVSWYLADELAQALPRILPRPRPGRREQACRCTLRDAPPCETRECPPRVFAVVPEGTSIGICQEIAKGTAPVNCRAYYGHCGWLQ